MKEIAQPYVKGSIILTEKPFVYILNSKQRKIRCDYCFARTELLKCTGCGITHYCDRGCQKSGWYFHKKECSCLKRVAPKVVPDMARLLARTLFKLEQGGAREQGFYTNRSFRVFMDLMSHYQEIKADIKRMEHFEALSAVLEEFLGAKSLPNPIELLRIYGKLVVNTFSILDGEMQNIGTGMYIGSSVVDHSCNPNAVVVFEGTTLNMRTLIDIPRCLNVEELNLMTSSLCQNCKQRILGGMRIEEAKCEACGFKVTSETMEEIEEISQFTNQQLTTMKDVAYLDVCRMCLKKQDSLFDPMNILRVRVLDLAMESSIELGNWEEAVHYGRRLIEPFLKYYGEDHPITGLFFMKMGKMGLLLGQKEDAKTWLAGAGTILRTTHGDQHHLVRHELYDYMKQCCN